MQIIHKFPVFITLAACVMLTACFPNPNLPKSQPAPPVTGDFDEVFAPGTAKAEAFKQPTLEERLLAQLEERNEALARARTQGNKAELANLSNPYKGDFKVAVLLPLTGSASGISTDLMDAAMLAVYDSKNVNVSGYSVTLLPKDTASSPSVAAAVARQAIEEGAQLIVGPLYSQEVFTVKQVSGEVPIITFSNNNEVQGPKSFVFGLPPESEVARVTEYAMKQGKLRFAALVPNNEYGMKLESALQASIAAKGGQVDNIVRFIDSDGGRKASAKRLAEKIKIDRVDALFIADSAENSKLLMNELRAQGVDVAALTLVGTSQWSDADPKEIPKELHMGIFAAGNDRSYQRFAERFNAALKRTPARISTFAYDAIAQVAEMTKKGTIPTAEALVETGIIQGRAVGTYRFEADGSVSRSLAIYQFGDKGVDTLEVAPKEF